MPFPRVLALCEMQTDSTRIWTWVTVFISYSDNRYTTRTKDTSKVGRTVLKRNNPAYAWKYIRRVTPEAPQQTMINNKQPKVNEKPTPIQHIKVTIAAFMMAYVSASFPQDPGVGIQTSIWKAWISKINFQGRKIGAT